MVRQNAIILVKLDENRLNDVRDIQRFSVFAGDTFSIWKIDTSRAATFNHATPLFIEFEYLDHNPQTTLELVERFFEKTDYYVFSIPPRKG